MLLHEPAASQTNLLPAQAAAPAPSAGRQGAAITAIACAHLFGGSCKTNQPAIPQTSHAAGVQQRGGLMPSCWRCQPTAMPRSAC